MTARTRREEVIDSVIHALEQAHTGLGYAFDYKAVYDFSAPESPEVPALCVIPGTEFGKQRSSGKSEGSKLDRTISIDVEGRHSMFHDTDLPGRTVCSLMIADIERAVLSDYTQGGTAISTEFVSSVPLLLGEESEVIAFVRVTFEITYRTRHAEPSER